MSLPTFNTQAPLFSTVPLDGQFFGPADRYGIFARTVYPALVQARQELVAAYCPDNGRPATEPVLLMGLSLLQYLEGVPDRQAVELLRYHAGWNFALNRSLGDEVFHPSVLSYFRHRLIKHDLSPVVFAGILNGLREAGLVQRGGKQRLDSTQMMGWLSRMSRLECVRETLRLALEELEQSAAAFGRPLFWDLLWERYVESKLDYRSEAAVFKNKMDQAGTDAWQLLQWLDKLSDAQIRAGRQAQLLRRVFEENFELEGQGPVQRPAQPPGAVHNPHEPQAQWAAKGAGKQRKEHVGYKVQVAETVVEGRLEPGEPTRNFLTAVVTQPAIGSDEAGLEKVEQEQAAMGLDKPEQWYVDGAYVSAGKLAQAQAEGRDLIGPAQAAPKQPGRFSVEDFDIRVEQRRAVCPAGKENTQCSRLEEAAGGKVTYRFEWSRHCAGCELKEQCLGKGQKHRTVVVGEHHTVLQARRKEQQTEAFQKKMHQRNAVEGTQSELVRAHGLRRARYRGKEKVRLQNYFIGAACNAKRWIKRIMWELKKGKVGARLAVESG